jgi:uncharacterized protein (DUF4415 family)
MSKAKSTSRRTKELRVLRRKPDSRIDTGDIPEIRNWDDAVRGKFYRPVKKAISLRLDADVLEWFKARNDRYQSKINEILREYMRKH